MFILSTEIEYGFISKMILKSHLYNRAFDKTYFKSK